MQVVYGLWLDMILTNTGFSPVDKRQMIVRQNIIISGLLVLFLGFSIYLFLYPNKFNYGYKLSVNSPWLLLIIFSITSFCHVFFMTAFSVGMSRQFITTKSIISWGFFWATIDTSFEILQSFEKTDFYLGDNLLSRYFNNGFFDINDIVAIWVGFVLVVIALMQILRKGKRND